MSPLGLLKQALHDYYRHRGLITGIILVVSLPLLVLQAYNVIDTNSDTTAAAYASFAQLVMNMAVIYASITIVSRQSLPRVRDAYYKGSAALVRLFLVSVMLVLMLLFLLLGLFIAAAGVLSPNASLQFGEQALLIGLAIIVSLPSFWLLPRSVFSIYMVFESEIGPLQAVQAAWKTTTRRTWRTLGYMAALGIFLLLLMALPLGIMFILQALTQWTVWASVLQLVATLIIIPVSNLYLYRYLWNVRG